MATKPTAPAEPEIKAPPTEPSTDTKDSLGNEKELAIPLGRAPVGPDRMTAEERRKIEEEQEARLRVGMSSTDQKDSIGKAKGSRPHIPQGVDKHGMRLPDKPNLAKPVEPAPAHVGPRGKGAPPDSYHGPKPAPKV